MMDDRNFDFDDGTQRPMILIDECTSYMTNYNYLHHHEDGIYLVENSACRIEGNVFYSNEPEFFATTG